jgi:hypothetical protein
MVAVSSADSSTNTPRTTNPEAEPASAPYTGVNRPTTSRQANQSTASATIRRGQDAASGTTGDCAEDGRGELLTAYTLGAASRGPRFRTGCYVGETLPIRSRNLTPPRVGAQV